MKRLLIILLSTMFVVSTLFIGIGCKTEAAPVEEAAEEVEEAAPAEETAEESKPVAEEEVQGPFEGTEIYYISGSLGGSFTSVMDSGMYDAAEVLGVDLKVLYSEWDPAKMLEQFKEAVALEPDGIIVAGFMEEDAIKPHVDDAISKGIIITTWGIDLPEIEKVYKEQGFGFVGTHFYEAGNFLGTEAARLFNLGPETKAMVWGLLHQTGRGVRTQGIIDALEEAGVTVDYLEISDSVNADPAAGTPVIAGYLAANPDTDAVFFDHGGLTASSPVYFEAAGYAPDEILSVGFDLSPSVVSGIKDGYVDLVLDTQQYLFGFLPILQVCLTKYGGFSGLQINTGSGLVHQGNIDDVAPLVEKLIR